MLTGCPNKIASLQARDIYYAKYYGKGRGGMVSWGKKIKLGVREKNEKGKRKNYIKKVKKALKMHLFGL